MVAAQFLSRGIRIGLIAGVVAAGVFVVADLIDALTRPGYNPLRHWISHLALGEFGWIGTLVIVVSAALLCWHGGALLVLRRREWLRTWYPFAVTIAGVGLFAAGIFPMAPSLGFPPGSTALDAPAGANAIHQVAGPVFILGLAVAAFLSAKFLRAVGASAAWSGLGWLVGTVIIVSFAATSTLVSFDYAGLVPEAWSGLFERIAAYLGLAWTAIVAVRVLRA